MTKITIDRVTVEQALEAIAEFVSNELTFGQRYTNEGQCLLDSITALRQALEQPRPAPPELEAAVNDALGLTAQLEPVATLWQHGETGRTRITTPDEITDCDARWFKAADLYTHPPVIDKSAAIRIATALGWEPKREWVGLTMEDKKRILESDFGGSRLDCMDEAEKILKEKNT